MDFGLREKRGKKWPKMAANGKIGSKMSNFSAIFSPFFPVGSKSIFRPFFSKIGPPGLSRAIGVAMLVACKDEVRAMRGSDDFLGRWEALTEASTDAEGPIASKNRKWGRQTGVRQSPPYRR